MLLRHVLYWKLCGNISNNTQPTVISGLVNHPDSQLELILSAPLAKGEVSVSHIHWEWIQLNQYTVATSVDEQSETCQKQLALRWYG